MARRPSKKKMASLKSARDRVEAAKGFRRHHNYDDLWKRMIDLYRGKHFPKDISAQDLFVVNVAKATVDVILPSVAVNNPKLTVNANDPEHAEHAIIVEAVVNYWWQHYDVLPEFKAALKDYLIVGFGWVKVGYRFVEEEQEDLDGYEAEVGRRMAEVEAFASENPALSSGLPTEEEIRNEVDVTSNTVVLDSRPFAERVSPFDVFVDPEAKSLRDARWIAQRVYKTLAEVQAEKGYTKAGRDNVQADGRTPDQWTSGFGGPQDDFENTSDDAKRVTVWEYYDLENDTMCVFSDAGEHFLIDPVEMPYEMGHPFVMLRNYNIPDKFYPMGELEPIEALQNELNLTRTQMFADRKQYQRRWIARRDAFDERGVRDLKSDEDNVVVFVNGNEPLDQVISRMPAQEVNPQLFQDTSVIESDLREVSGVSEYQRGATPETRRTATEVNVMADAADARAQEKLASVEGFVGEIAEKLLKLAQQFLSEPQVARIAQRDGLPFHFEFEPSDIEGEFDFTVVGGSTKPLNEQTKREMALELLNTLAPFGDPQIGMVNMSAVLEHVLREGFGINDASKFLANGNPITQGMGMGPEEVPMDAESEELPPEMAAMMAQGGAPPPAAALPPSEPQGEIPPELMAMLAQAGGQGGAI